MPMGPFIPRLRHGFSAIVYLNPLRNLANKPPEILHENAYKI